GPAVQPPQKAEPEAENPETSQASSRAGSSPAETSPAEASSGGVVAADMMALDGSALPTLIAESGDRVVVDLGDRRETSFLLARFAGLEPLDGSIDVAGKQLGGASHGRLRRLVGYAAQGLMLGRGTIANAVRYRATDASDATVYKLIGTVGLWPRLREL